MHPNLRARERQAQQEDAERQRGMRWHRDRDGHRDELARALIRWRPCQRTQPCDSSTISPISILVPCLLVPCLLLPLSRPLPSPRCAPPLALWVRVRPRGGGG